MNRIFALMFLSLFLVACNKDGAGSDCSAKATPVAEETADSSTGVADTGCTVETTPPVTGETTGSTTSGNESGGTTSGSTGSTTGSTTSGSTTGSSTGGTTGGTTGTTTGGTTGGSPGTGLPNGAYTFDTNITFVNANADQLDKFERAIEMIKKVVETEEFRSKILNHTYGGKKTFVDNGGFTNEEIYEKILEAAETLKPTKNNTMDLEVELYYAATSTVGYTYANSKRIWVNTKYFNSNSVGAVAANLFHEWLHKLGFKHAVSYSTSRDYSVPYAIGRMVNTIGSKL